MRFWFVNLGKYYKEQRDGRYLWAPLYNERGGINSHWDRMKDVNRGDVFLCNNNGRIFSVGIAKDHAYLSQIPDEFEQTWRPEGRRIDLKFIDVNEPLRYKDYKDYILNNINPEENPFDVNGNAKLGYLFPIDERIAVYLLNKINNNEIDNLLIMNDINLQNEIEEFKEEQEQFEKINNGSIKGYSTEQLRQMENEKYNYKPIVDEGKKRIVREKTDAKLKATRMELANHLCEINHDHKTFTNASGDYQYLECHHIIPMNAQRNYPNIKLDSMFNIIALCPICHSQVHYATLNDKRNVFFKMYEIRKKEMMEHGFDDTKINEVFNKYYK